MDYENDEIYKVKIFDPDIVTKRDEKPLSLRFVKEVRNYGPGTVKTLDIELPIPENRDSQTPLSAVRFDPEPNEVIETSASSPGRSPAPLLFIPGEAFSKAA